MKKNKDLLIVVLAIFSLAMTGYAFNLKSKINNFKKQIDFETQIVKTENSADEIKIQYPNFNEEKLNTLVKNFIDNQKQQFENLKIDQGEIEGLEGKNSLYIEYNSFRHNNNIVSFKFDISQYVLGMAHPNNFIVTKTYNLLENKEIELDNLFVDDKYLTTIAQISSEELLNQLPEDLQDLIREGTKPEKNNYANFVLTENDLVFIFNPSQVAPYAFGSQEVKIDLNQIKNLLKSEFKENIL